MSEADITFIGSVSFPNLSVPCSWDFYTKPMAVNWDDGCHRDSFSWENSSSLSRSLTHHIMLDMVGTLMPNLLATRDWAIAASSSENRCAISTSVFARLIALLKRSMALLRLPLQQVTCRWYQSLPVCTT